MSTAVIEAPVQTASQLCFAWDDQPFDTNSGETNSFKTAGKSLAAPKLPAIDRQRPARLNPLPPPPTTRKLIRISIPSLDESPVKHSPVKNAPVNKRAGEVPAVANFPPVPAAPLAVRGSGEVRIGAVMLKLLKRYGITDQEIADGLASYAQKQCQSAVS
jgi:hypothetical protein